MKEIILEQSKKCLNDFDVLKDTLKFEYKGVLLSEMVIVSALQSHYSCSDIIESGRARGFSTEILDSVVDSKVRLTSVEWAKYTKDSFIATKKFLKNTRVNLVYGNSFEVLPSIEFHNNAIVVIDGPKGNDAVLLAAELLRNPQIKAVLIHDLHSTADGRQVLEDVFPDFFFTDDSDYVKLTKGLDDNCWEKMRSMPELGKGWAPYLRDGIKNESYGNTFGVIFNTPAGLDLVEQTKKRIAMDKSDNSTLSTSKRKIRRGLEIIKDTVYSLFWFVIITAYMTLRRNG